MKNQLSTLFLLFFMSFGAFAQPEMSPLDSLEKAWKNSESDIENQLESLLEIARLSEESDEIERVWKLGQKGKQLLDDGEVNKSKSDFLLEFIFGTVCFNSGEILESLRHFESADKLFYLLTDENEKVAFLNAASRTFGAAGLFEKSIFYRQRIFTSLRKSGDSLKLAQNYGNIAITYGSLENYDLSEKYNKLSAKLFEEIGQKEMTALATMNLGLAHSNKGENRKALEAYKKSEKLLEGTNSLAIQAAIYDHLGYYYLNLEDFENAEVYLFKGLSIREQLSNKLQLASSYVGLSQLFHQTGNHKSALNYGNKAVTTVQELGDEGMHYDALMARYNALSSSGLHKEALVDFEKAVAIMDSLKSEDIKAIGVEFDLKHQYELRSTSDSLENNKKVELQKQKTKAIQTEKSHIVWGSVIVVLLLIGFAFFALVKYRKEAKQKSVIEEQQIMLENDYHSLKEFTENASHEMQTPMAIINSKLEGLMQSQRLSENQLKQIQLIYTTTYRMSTMNRSLLLLSKIENNQFPKESKINLSKLFSQILEEFDEMMEHKQIKKKFFISPNVTKEANEFLSSTIFYNLVKNAISHNIENGDIEVSLDQNSMFVENNGSELDQDPVQLFERFKKSSNNENSTGLGLAIVKKSCESQGWNVNYHYNNGRHRLEIDFS